MGYWTNEKMDKAFGHLEGHQYKHFNRSLGMVIKSKEHFREALERGGYVSQEDGERLAEKQRNSSKKEYRVSEKTRRAIGALKATADKTGKLSSREGTLRAMEDCGVDIKQLTKVPEKFKPDADGFYTI